MIIMKIQLKCCQRDINNNMLSCLYMSLTLHIMCLLTSENARHYYAKIKDIYSRFHRPIFLKKQQHCKHNKHKYRNVQGVLFITGLYLLFLKMWIFTFSLSNRKKCIQNEQFRYNRRGSSRSFLTFLYLVWRL